MIFVKLFIVFFKIGIFGFGGGYAMLSLIQDEVVTKNHWLTQQEFTDLVAISQMTPGPIGINSATYVGFTALHQQTSSVYMGVLGAAVTTFSICLPAFILISIISYFFLKFRQNRYFSSAIKGIKPLSISLIALAALSLTNKENFIDWFSIVLFIATIILSIKFKVHPILLLIIGAIVGIIYY